MTLVLLVLVMNHNSGGGSIMLTRIGGCHGVRMVVDGDIHVG